jgi:hypothetical protein
MEENTRNSKGRTALIVAGAFVAVLGAIVVAAGGTVLWQTGKSDGGYFSSGTHRFASQSHAIVTDGVKVDSDVPRWLIGRARITATSSDGKPVFIGIARKSDVDAYLAGVSQSEIRNLEYSPFSVDYANRTGATLPARPGSRSIWAASTSGTGEQQLTWRLRSGDWRVVLMNADGSSGIDAGVIVGGTIDHALPIALGVTGGGLLVLLFGLAVIVAARGRQRPPGVPAVA